MDVDIKPRGSGQLAEAAWTPVQYLKSAAGPLKIKGAVTGTPERVYAARVVDVEGNAHYFQVPESQWKIVIKQLQALVGDVE